MDTSKAHGRTLERILSRTGSVGGSEGLMEKLVACSQTTDGGGDIMVYHNNRKLNQELGSPFTYRTHNKNFVGCETPWCFNLKWRPQSGMVYCGAELAVAVYILSENMDKHELLVSDSACFGSRGNLHSLVIDLVAGNLSHEKDTLRWFLPTIFSRMALSPDKVNSRKMVHLRDRYMGEYQDVEKVDFLEKILGDGRFFMHLYTTKPNISGFRFQETDVPQQEEGS
ncbi:hypothetical protein PIB30_021991 [Stylosanthes scabra]|uniref:Uncharacterized protein n=1 Tax=Stylosanthes scabra TaxID=79078 RepID=A0ABU6WA61_9FABA|nr:hypothetical protein [Stylosanthes scabra]